MTKIRLVLIDSVAKNATVYENKVALATYNFTDTPLTREDVEWVRTQEYKDKA